MKKIKISIGGKQYKVKLAVSEEEHEIGLQGVSELADDEGMLFEFEEPEEVSFWMEDTQIPLDVIFIDEDMEVIAVHEGIPMSKEFMTEDDTLYVLELNKDSGVVKGDELEFENSKKVKKDMEVLDSNGESQMSLDGGERIFSRPNTKTLIKFAKKADTTEKDKDYKAVGARVFKFLKTQDENDSEYVELDSKSK